MLFEMEEHRFANAIIAADDELRQRYNEFISAIEGITDTEIIEDFLRRQEDHAERNTDFKSITPSINHLLKKRMEKIDGWESEVDIFNDTEGIIENTEWRLDFACEGGFAIEVAFNHGEAIAWNLLKPVLASEQNHVEKALQTRMAIYVCAMEEMKRAGNIDSASGSFEKVKRYLKPMMNQLVTPMVLIGLKAPETFFVDDAFRKIFYRFNILEEKAEELNWSELKLLRDEELIGKIIKLDNCKQVGVETKQDINKKTRYIVQIKSTTETLEYLTTYFTYANKNRIKRETQPFSVLGVIDEVINHEDKKIYYPNLSLYH